MLPQLSDVKEVISKNVVKVPGNFKEFVEKQTPKWVNNTDPSGLIQKQQLKQ